MNDDRAGSDHLREKILLAVLPHVPFEGWSEATLGKGCADAGLSPGESLRVFPGGVPDLVEYFSAYADEKMCAVLAGQDMTAMRMRDRIAAGLRVRFELLARHREAVRRACAYLALPQHAGLALATAARTVDAIWRAVGDEATDFSFYTKRALLAGVYGATLLYWLDDDSEGFQDTLAFLDRRIDDVMRIGKTRERAERALHDATERVGRFFRRPADRD